MNSKNQEDLKNKIDEYEVEVQYSPSKVLNQIGLWYNALPSPVKLVVLVFGVVLGFSLLASVFRLLTALITLGSLGIILYLVYKFWIAPRSPKI
jgi:hypothetical protein